jgi:hypothetical protein
MGATLQIIQLIGGCAHRGPTGLTIAHKQHPMTRLKLGLHPELNNNIALLVRNDLVMLRRQNIGLGITSKRC